MIKKIFLSVLLCTVCMLSMAQSQTVTHVVQRGETLESIAEYYKVSVEDINKANPNADGIVYVGMKLVLPVGATSTTTEATAQQKSPKATTRTSQTSFNKSQSENNQQTTHTTSYNKNIWKLRVIAGLTSGSWTGKDFKDGDIDTGYGRANAKNKAAYQFHAGLIADYVFSKNMYAGLGIVFNQSGYKQDYLMTSGQYWEDEGGNYDGEQTVKMTTNKLDIPIHIGGMYNFSTDTRLFIEAGPYLSYTISGNKKRTGTFTEYDDIHSSETEHINDKEKIGKGSLKDFQKFGYGLSATVGASFNKIILQFTYQRGLNKTIKKKKQYEQNMLLSLGYEF